MKLPTSIKPTPRWCLYRDGRIVRKPFYGEAFEHNLVAHEEPTEKGLKALQDIRNKWGKDVIYVT